MYKSKNSYSSFNVQFKGFYLTVKENLQLAIAFYNYVFES